MRTASQLPWQLQPVSLIQQLIMCILLVFPLLLLVQDWYGNPMVTKFFCVYALHPTPLTAPHGVAEGLSHLSGEPSNPFHHSHPPWQSPAPGI